MTIKHVLDVEKFQKSEQYDEKKKENDQLEKKSYAVRKTNLSC